MTAEDIPDRLTSADMDLFRHDEAKHARLRQQRREQGIPEPTNEELGAGFHVYPCYVHDCIVCEHIADRIAEAS